MYKYNDKLGGGFYLVTSVKKVFSHKTPFLRTEKRNIPLFFEKIYTIGTLLAIKKMDIIAKDF